MEKVAVLGASNKADRYSNKAVNLLIEHGHQVYPVNPVAEEISGLKVYKTLDDLPHGIDTLTVYLNPKLVSDIVDKIIDLSPSRVIFNPGTENPEAMKEIEASGIKVITACTLVMLKTDQY